MRNLHLSQARLYCHFNFLVEASLSDSGGRQKLLERAKEKRVGLGMEGQGWNIFCLPHYLNRLG